MIDRLCAMPWDGVCERDHQVPATGGAGVLRQCTIYSGGGGPSSLRAARPGGSVGPVAGELDQRARKTAGLQAWAKFEAVAAALLGIPVSDWGPDLALRQQLLIRKPDAAGRRCGPSRTAAIVAGSDRPGRGRRWVENRPRSRGLVDEGRSRGSQQRRTLVPVPGQSGRGNGITLKPELPLGDAPCKTGRWNVSNVCVEAPAHLLSEHLERWQRSAGLWDDNRVTRKWSCMHGRKDPGPESGRG